MQCRTTASVVVRVCVCVRALCRASLAAGLCIDLAVHSSSIEKGEDFAAAVDQLGLSGDGDSPTDSGSSTSPSDNTSEDSAPALEMRSLIHEHATSHPASPPRSVSTG